jgi:hypothetical protein
MLGFGYQRAIIFNHRSLSAREMFQRYDFNATLSSLDEIGQWLNGLGFTATDRVRTYSRNIRKMLEVQASGGMEELQATIPLDKAREIFWSYVDADEFVRAVTALRNSLGDELAAAPIEKALNGPADLLLERAKNSDGRNFMFELIVGGRLAGAGFSPSFDKGPDVQVEFAGLQVGIQCKRPFSTAGLERNIKKAIHQLEAGQADFGLIAVSVSRLLNSGDPYDIPEVEHHDLGHALLQTQVHQVAEQTKRFWFGKLDRAGILFYAFSPIRSRQAKGYFPQRYEAIFPLDAHDFTLTLLKCFVQSLKT